jgi:hypothetical protein
MWTLKLVVTAGTTHPDRGPNWIESLVGTKLFHGEKSRFKLPTIPSGASTLGKRGYCFFPEAEAAADAIEVSFLYSALA